MADFETYQEYQRLDDYEEDSPPGEEDLLIHVPEGLKGMDVILSVLIRVVESIRAMRRRFNVRFLLRISVAGRSSPY